MMLEIVFFFLEKREKREFEYPNKQRYLYISQRNIVGIVEIERPWGLFGRATKSEKHRNNTIFKS